MRRDSKKTVSNIPYEMNPKNKIKLGGGNSNTNSINLQYLQQDEYRSINDIVDISYPKKS